LPDAEIFGEFQEIATLPIMQVKGVNPVFVTIDYAGLSWV